MSMIQQEMKKQVQKLFSREMIWKWGLLLVLLADAILFYHLMRIEVYFPALCFFTWLFLSLFYFGFRNRWIPFGIHILLSVLMFADVMFNAYFNGYLSLNMLGSAKYVGDVMDIVLEVIRPQFFLLFAWIPFGAAAIFMDRPKAKQIEAAGVPEEADVLVEAPQLAFWRKRWSREVLLVVLLLLLAVNPLQPVFFQSIGSLELFSYHIKDILKAGFGLGEEDFEVEAPLDYQVGMPDAPDTLFGAAEGRNLIIIQVEALQNFVIGAEYNGQEITPVLNELIQQDTLYFDHYYMQIGAGNTSDAEFATNNSLYGSNKSYTYEIYKDNAFRGLPWLLKEKGYKTIVMHGFDGKFWSRNEMYPAQGFDLFVDTGGFQVKGTPTSWGISDEDFFTQAVDYLLEQEGPFYSFLITLSSHTPFELPRKLEQYSNITIKKEDEGTRFGNYINSISYTDYALGIFLEKLKEADLYENSVIAVYGDHFGLALSDDRNDELMGDFLGREYRFSDAANIPLIIHIPHADTGVALPKKVEKAGGQLDFLPTIAYLMGFDSLDTIYLGSNLLNGNSGFVIQDRYAPPGSFLTDTTGYMGIGDGVFETGKAWNLRTGEDLRKDDGMQKLWRRAKGLLNLSTNILQEDRIREMYYGDGKPDRTDMEMPKVAPARPKSKEIQKEPEVEVEILSPGALTPGAVSPGATSSGAAIPGAGESEELTSGGAAEGTIPDAMPPGGTEDETTDGSGMSSNDGGADDESAGEADVPAPGLMPMPLSAEDEPQSGTGQ